MTQRLSLLALCLAALLTGGCLSSKKSSAPKESSAIAGSVEESFRLRWVDKRAAELTAQGKAAAAARDQANEEFLARYVYTAGAQKK